MKRLLVILYMALCPAVFAAGNVLLPIEVKGLWGYMDQTGKMVIQPQYDLAEDFNEGYAVVALKNMPCMINLKNKRVIDTGFYRSIGLYSEGLSYVKDFRNHRFYVDSTGKKIITLSDSIYDARPFHGGIAVIGLQYDKHEIKFNVDISTIAFKFAYIGKDGKYVTGFDFDDADDVSEGLARIKKGDLFGLIDTKGTLVVKPTYYRLDLFYADKAVALLNGKFGFINRKGEWVIQPQYEIAYDFSEGLAGVMIKGKYGYINTNGELVIPAVYEQIRAFSEGMAAVQQNGLWGFINAKTETVIPFRFDNATVFSEGYCAVLIKRKWGFISKYGQTAVSPEFDAVGSFQNGVADVVYHDISLYIDQRGNILPKLD